MRPSSAAVRRLALPDVRASEPVRRTKFPDDLPDDGASRVLGALEKTACFEPRVARQTS